MKSRGGIPPRSRGGGGQELRDDIDQLGTVLHESKGNEGYHIVTQSCLCSLEQSIIDRFEKHNCLYQSPTIYRQGWEHYTVVAFDGEDIRELLGDLRSDREIELLSKTSISEKQIPHSMLAPANQLFENITDRQLAALQLALESGYYEQPRKTSLRDLADQTAVARSTYEEHLRKAENKLLTNAGQFLRLVTATSAADPLQVEETRRTEQAAD
ncbi:XRE family transcriptional regulator [Halorubrum ezzemoulense]|uniref:XRE family transcriptional regulator n=1 Tax=Halorubrum ezzemoulense TaxID=337243 RepID=A0A256IJX0_HALEZ|nr:XRE family transcriptional regulator [Halorubrum ezzemoulense]PHQ40749.1 XRE family transcriptional regulator [Halorubrum sp. C191]QAY21651.1 XRE family transcriptional regulator [Halorubrum ezzemoulense]